MRVEHSVLLTWPLERVLAELAHTDLLNALDAPVLAFQPVEPRWLPETWRPGVYRMQLRLAGFLPIGEHTMDVRLALGADDLDALPADGPVEVWLDAGHSDLIRRWEHRIRLERFRGMTRYTDVAEIEAGLLTLPAWLFGRLLYRTRQRRLRELVQSTLD